ncbi:sigma-70 family RNA polymerase sigma factor [Dolichospermum sp. UHCC 0259]|uniref:sigma-70 family RNA polymerase sigma factor n=1 Tax=Dolichospermum sp. UHCC 0259 TaxID=2590010 RepID=UPI001444E297|nr:sigma-70 family RNA polymerase sigma factor [Dolichospermum sp. UHCC 0259]MTJ50352.1 sigma-70 family RNA polymerase sigma factor [Dolichospermum sp. UHCC 0259]
MKFNDSSARSDGIDLLYLYYTNPSIQLRNQIVELHKGLVRKIAYKFSHKCYEPYEDLEQIGYFGLIRAIERFDPEQGYALSSFAVPYIRGEILHFLRDNSTLLKIPRRCQEVYSQGQKIRKELAISLDHPPKEIEVANKLHISLEEWQATKLAVQNRNPLSLDNTASNYVNSPVTWADLLPCHHSMALQQQQEEKEQLEGAISMLDDKPRMAVELVFVKQLTRKDAAKKIGATPMTVTRYLQQGLQQLITYLQPTSIATGS